MKIKNLFKLLTLLTIGIGYSSCEIINPEEGIPSYVEIPEITVGPTAAINTGTLSNKITQVRLTVIQNNVADILGTFTLPATIPILLEGEQIIEFDPVIKANGNSFSLEIYPFYERIVRTVNLVPGEVQTLNLETKYKENITVRFQEDLKVVKYHFLKEI